MFKMIGQLFFVFAFSFNVFAQETDSDPKSPGGDSQPVYQIDVVEVNADSDVVQELIEKSRSVIEGDETGKFLQDWAEAFNAKKKIVDAVRWVSASKDVTLHGMALDSAVIFGISHSLETASGPILVTTGIANGWPDWLITSLGIAGGVISVPGLDPLCIVIFIAYGTNEHFRTAVRTVRIALVRGIKGAATVTGLKSLLQKTFTRPDYKEFFLNIEHLDKLTVMDDGRSVAEFHFPSKEEAQLKVVLEAREKGRAYLKQVWVSENFTFVSKVASRRWLKTLGWNARDFIEKFVLERVMFDSAATKPYVDSVSQQGSAKNVVIKDFAVGVGPHFELRKTVRINKCQALFLLKN
jgi:hypothetical protein